jgi:hypothetical protein
VGLLRPAPGTKVTDRTPLGKAKATDEHTDLREESLTLFLDDKAIPRQAFAYDRATNRLSYTPTTTLAYGKHRVRIVAADSAKVATTKTWSFRVVRPQ